MGRGDGQKRDRKRWGWAWKRPPFHIAPLGWLILVPVLLLALAFLFLLTLPGSVPETGLHDQGQGGRPSSSLPAAASVMPAAEKDSATSAAAEAPVEPVIPVPAPAVKERQTAGEPSAVTPKRQVRYAVQIRAYPESRLDDAKAYLKGIRQHHPEAALETVSIKGRGVWHRVLLGRFASKEEAEAYRSRPEVIRAYPDSFVQRRSSDRPQASAQ